MIIELIERAVGMTGTVAGAVRADQWALPTPCAGWMVRDELNHVVGGMQIFTAQLDGRDDVGDHDADRLGTDPAGAYTRAAQADRRAWRAPGALDRTVTIALGTLPGPMAAAIHLTEVLVHGVDIAVAIDRADLVDERLCADLLDVMDGLGGVDAYRVPGVFDAAVQVPQDGPVHRRLLAHLGRRL